MRLVGVAKIGGDRLDDAGHLRGPGSGRGPAPRSRAAAAAIIASSAGAASTAAHARSAVGPKL
jgi:hypothetical protein